MTADAPDHDRGGWVNVCPVKTCHRHYWVRVSDMGKDHMRRFEGRESSELHRCTVVPASSP